MPPEGETGARPYHHGDLHRALLDAALALVESQGAQGFTLREVARRVGVTHSAPYRHFKDKAELLAAVAAEGFKLLGERLISARDAAGSDPAARMRAIGVQYVCFALEHPAHYRVMFGRELQTCPPEHPMRVEGERTFGVLMEVVSALKADGAPDNGPARALISWATVHGLAMLMADRRLPVEATPEGRAAQIGALLDAFDGGF